MTVKRFALIADGDVFGLFLVENDPSLNPNGPRLDAGLSSDPKVIPIPENLDVQPGWSWNGIELMPPS